MAMERGDRLPGLRRLGVSLGEGILSGIAGGEVLSRAPIDAFSSGLGDAERASRLLQGLGTSRASGFVRPQANVLVWLGAAAILHAMVGGALHFSTQEARISGARSETDPRRDALVQQARDLVWEGHLEKGAGRGSGAFLLGTESLKPRLGDRENKLLIDQWNAKMAIYAQQLAQHPEPHAKIRVLMNTLYWDYLFHFGGKNRKMSDFFTKGKGNCVAQTKLVVAAITDQQIQLPSNEGIAVQVFRGHVQPVFYARDEEGNVVEVRNLVTGEKIGRVVAPLYDTSILAHGFLRKQGAYIVTGAEELLIAQPKPEDVMRAEPKGGGGDTADETEEFPDSEAVFKMDAPDDARLLPPDFGDFGVRIDQAPGRAAASWEEAMKARDAGRAAAPSASASSPVASPPAKGAGRHAVLLFSEIDPKEVPQDLDFTWGGRFIAYRTEELRQRHGQLQSWSEVAQFMAQLTHVAVARIAATPHFQEYLADPSGEVSRMNTSEIRGVIGAVKRYQLASGRGVNGFKIFTMVALGSSDGDLDQDALTRMADAQAMREFSEVWNMDEKLKSVISSIEQDPRPMVLLLNSLGGERSRSYIGLLGKISKPQEQLMPILEIPALEHLLSDPALVGVAAKADQQTPYVPREQRLIWIDLEGTTQVLPPEDRAPEAPQPLEPAATTQPAEIMISQETMVDLLIAVGGRAVSGRWDASASATFLAMNAQGYRDTEFVTLCWVLMGTEKFGVDAKKLSREQTQELYREMRAAVEDPEHSRYLSKELASTLAQVVRRSGPGSSLYQRIMQ